MIVSLKPVEVELHSGVDKTESTLVLEEGMLVNPATGARVFDFKK